MKALDLIMTDKSETLVMNEVNTNMQFDISNSRIALKSVIHNPFKVGAC